MNFDLDKVAIIAGKREVTFAQMLQHIGTYAVPLDFDPADFSGDADEQRPKCLIYAPNSEGWVYALYAIWAKKGIAVPIDATSTAEDLAYILSDCTPSHVWTTHTKMDTMREAMHQSGVHPKVLFIEDMLSSAIDNATPNDAASPAPLSVLQLSDDVLRIALIVYTSGTTGSPKGVMLTFDNLLANIEGVWKDVHIFDERRRTMMLLPVHHVLPLMGSVIAPLLSGGGIAICPSLSGTDIMATLNRGKVAIIIGVPRLWQTLYQGIKQKIDASLVTKALFWLCAKIQSRKLSRFVFQSIRKKMGGHLDFCVCGGAALDIEIGRGMKTLGLDVLEGYGMTEAAPVIAFTRPGDIRPGCVGKALPAVQCKLKDGELCAKGRNIMAGYYHRPEETAAVLKDRWLHTGDLATIDEEGYITITGRTKEIIVLSNGKNINPTELEFKLEKFTDLVKEAAVVPEGDRLCAIIVPQKDWAQEKNEEELEAALKEQVLKPYNQSVETYKRVLNLFVFHGDLPRTKLDKLQRFKLEALLKAGVHTASKPELVEPTFEEYRLIKQYILDEKHPKQVLPTDHIETDLGFDSLDKVGLQGFIEQTFGMELTVEDVARFANLADMAEHVAQFKTQMERADVDWHALLHDEQVGQPLPDTWPTGPWLVHMFKTFFKMHFRLASKGVKNIPAKGPFILAANHQSYLDGMFVMAYVNPRQIRNTYFFAKEKHVNTPLRRWLASRHNVVVLHQNNMKQSIQALGDVLRQNKNIIIFPEGTRTATGALGDFKKMFAILSLELRVPIVPVVINGAFEALPRGRKWPLPKKIVVEYLSPITPAEGSTYDSLTAQVRQAIQEKLKKQK